MHPLTLGSQNARRAIFIPKVNRKIHFLAGYPLTLGSQNARRAIFIPKVHRKIHFLAGYPLTLGSQNAGTGHFFPKVHKGRDAQKNPLHTDVEGTHISHRSWGFLRQVILLEIDFGPRFAKAKLK